MGSLAMQGQSCQVSNSGLRSVGLRDLDYVNPRPPLRSTALPPEVRAQLGMKNRAGGKAGKKFAAPMGDDNFDDKKISRASRVRRCPQDPLNLPRIGMANVLKKADKYAEKPGPTQYKDPDVFGEPRKRERRKPRSSEEGSGYRDMEEEWSGRTRHAPTKGKKVLQNNNNQKRGIGGRRAVNSRGKDKENHDAWPIPQRRQRKSVQHSDEESCGGSSAAPSSRKAGGGGRAVSARRRREGYAAQHAAEVNSRDARSRASSAGSRRSQSVGRREPRELADLPTPTPAEEEDQQDLTDLPTPEPEPAAREKRSEQGSGEREPLTIQTDFTQPCNRRLPKSLKLVPTAAAETRQAG